ncbi:MAG: hypothetical protein K9L22_02995 [Methylococcaceae bacterium]|nr:hypothetical protein [Methylococcaceae bacterium]
MLFTGILSGLLFLIYGAILLIDPFDNLQFSFDLKRVQVSGTDRFFKPSVARRRIYDSVIIGSSTVMLIHPHRLGELMSAKFATLAMPAASPFEQLRLLKLFTQHHPKTNYVLIGLDHIWCSTDTLPKLIGFNAGNRIPDELYDENIWNNWPAFSGTTIKYTKRQWKALYDTNQDSAGHDGYYDFTAKYSVYDLNSAQAKLYYGLNPIPEFNAVMRKPGLALEEKLSRDYPALRDLNKALKALPNETIKILVFVPFHWYEQSRTFSQFSECKNRVLVNQKQIENLHIIDFMKYSEITLTDTNFWDPIHFTKDIAMQVEHSIAKQMRVIATSSDLKR